MTRFLVAGGIALVTLVLVVLLTYFDRRTGPAGGVPAWRATQLGAVATIAALAYAMWGVR